MAGGIPRQFVDSYTQIAQTELGQAIVDGAATTAVAPTDSEYYQSPTWGFTPPSNIRDALAEAGQVTILAQQADLQASATQQLRPDTVIGQTWIDPGELAVYGFEPGTRVPVGQYEAAEPCGETMTLVEQIGDFVMPASRVAVFSVPQGLRDRYANQSTHCVAAPFGGTVYNCQPPAHDADARVVLVRPLAGGAREVRLSISLKWLPDIWPGLCGPK